MPGVGDKWFPDTPSGNREARAYSRSNPDAVQREGSGAHLYQYIVEQEDRHLTDPEFNKMASAPPFPPFPPGMMGAFFEELEKIAATIERESNRLERRGLSLPQAHNELRLKRQAMSQDSPPKKKSAPRFLGATFETRPSLLGAISSMANRAWKGAKGGAQKVQDARKANNRLDKAHGWSAIKPGEKTLVGRGGEVLAKGDTAIKARNAPFKKGSRPLTTREHQLVSSGELTPAISRRVSRNIRSGSDSDRDIPMTSRSAPPLPRFTPFLRVGSAKKEHKGPIKKEVA